MQSIKNIELKRNGIEFNIELKDNMVIINGESGVGKTILYKALQAEAKHYDNEKIICLNYNMPKEGIELLLNNSKGKIIVIDNTEMITSIAQRIKISMDKDNQYIIFSHTTDGFKPSASSIAELIVENNIGKLYYPLLDD